MTSAPPTITQLKEQFIASQTQKLAAPLVASTAFQTANERSDRAIDPRQLQSVSVILEGLIKDHCHRVYAPQANRALAEQISHSYTREAERKLRRDDVDEALGREVDLAEEKAIDSLSTTWTSERDIANRPAEAKRYAEAVENLASLNEQRRELRARVERLRRMKATVDPLRTEDGVSGLQENLITRNGDVEKELERMRMLLVRVAGRVESLPEGRSAKREDEDVKPLAELRKRDIDEFLADQKLFSGTE